MMSAIRSQWISLYACEPECFFTQHHPNIVKIVSIKFGMLFFYYDYFCIFINIHMVLIVVVVVVAIVTIAILFHLRVLSPDAGNVFLWSLSRRWSVFNFSINKNNTSKVSGLWLGHDIDFIIFLCVVCSCPICWK